MTDRAENNLIVLPQSEGENLLIYFDRARREIELASSVIEVKKIRDQAEVLRQYARQQKLSLDLQNSCAEIKIRSERRGGEILADMDLNPGGQAEHKSYMSRSGPGRTPRLADLGISRNQSSRWQAVASIPLQQFEERIDSLKNNGKELTSTEMLSYAGFLQRERERQEKREEAAARATDTPLDERIRIVHGDFRVALGDIPEDSVQLICTDPPYAGPQNDFLTLWEDLGKWASEMLAPGKLLIALCGNYCLFECMQALSKHLKYTWTSALVYGTGFSDTMFKYRLKTYWKPAIWFSKGEYRPDEVRTPWIHDIVTGDGGSKVHHKWEQGVDEFSHFIDGLTYPGDIVADPFVGSGTVAVAAKRLNRRFVGCDEDEAAVNMSRFRLSREGLPDAEN